MSATAEEFDRQRIERRRLRELDADMRTRNEAAVRAILDEYHPAGTPEDLVERICQVQNALIKEIVQGEKVFREMHDGINRIADESAQRWVSGFTDCLDQVRMHAAEIDLPTQAVDSLLRNDPRKLTESREERNEAASQQVEWKRG